MSSQEREVLEAFVVRNDDLERLEAALSQFNIFEAVGAVRQELRHSDFLAFLLDPGRPHALGDTFLKRLLKHVLHTKPNPPISAVEIDIADMSGASIRREWRNIDILIEDVDNGLVCVIENKVFSSEHSNQLERYRQIVAQRFPDCRCVFLFLTPEGDAASDESYASVSYSEIVDLTDAVREARESTVGAEVQTLMTHYTTMLRRYVVTESEIADLCRKLYREHRQALDLIYEHRPDLQYELFEMLQALVKEAASARDLVLDHSTKSAVRFAVEEWDRYAPQLAGEGWVPSDRVLLFEFANAADRLSLKLIIGPGPQPLRKELHRMLKGWPKLFNQVRGGTYKKYKTVYMKRLLSSGDYEAADWERIDEKVQRGWENFLDNDLPQIREVLEGIRWNELPTS